MRLSFKVQGLSRLDRALKELAGAVRRKVLEDAALYAVDPLVDEIQRRARERTGKLKDSIGKATAKRTSDRVIIEAGPREGYDRQHVARFLELGTSKMTKKEFIRPSVAATQDEVLERLNDRTWDNLRKVASRFPPRGA